MINEKEKAIVADLLCTPMEDEKEFVFPASWSDAERSHFARQYFAWEGCPWAVRTEGIPEARVRVFLANKLQKQKNGYTLGIPAGEWNAPTSALWLREYFTEGQYQELVRWCQEKERGALDVEFGVGATGVTVRVFDRKGVFLLNLTEYKE